MASRRSTSWQANGTAMHSLLYPVCNEREAMRRQGLKPKDHAKENVRRIRDMQNTQVPGLWRKHTHKHAHAISMKQKLPVPIFALLVLSWWAVYRIPRHG